MRRLIGALIRQIARQDDCVSEAVVAQYQEHEANDTMPTEESFLDLLTSEIGRFRKAFLIVDALDECPAEVRAALIRNLVRVQRTNNANVRILFSSRNIQIIAEELGDVHSLELLADPGDVETYIQEQVSAMPALRVVHKNPTLLQELHRILTQKAQGM